MLIPTKGIAFAIRFYFFTGPLAQLVEHRPFKAVVGGSNPARLNKLSLYMEIAFQWLRNGKPSGAGKEKSDATL